MQIYKINGQIYTDSRPLVRLNVSVTVKNKNKIETGSYGFGGRDMYSLIFKNDSWKNAVSTAYQQALIRLEAKAVNLLENKPLFLVVDGLEYYCMKL